MKEWKVKAWRVARVACCAVKVLSCRVPLFALITSDQRPSTRHDMTYTRHIAILNADVLCQMFFDRNGRRVNALLLSFELMVNVDS